MTYTDEKICEIGYNGRECDLDRVIATLQERKEKMYMMSDDTPVKCDIELIPEQEAEMAEQTKRIIEENTNKKHP